MCLAEAFGVTAAVAAVDRAVFGLGAAFERFVGLDVAGADPSQVVAMTPAACFDDVVHDATAQILGGAVPRLGTSG
jgi:hypothetical protein